MFNDMVVSTDVGDMSIAEFHMHYSTVVLFFYKDVDDECYSQAKNVVEAVDRHGQAAGCLLICLQKEQLGPAAFKRRGGVLESEHAMHCWGNSAIQGADQYGVRFLPHTVVIDRAGMVCHSGATDPQTPIDRSVLVALTRVVKDVHDRDQKLLQQADQVMIARGEHEVLLDYDPMRKIRLKQLEEATEDFNKNKAELQDLELAAPTADELHHLIEENTKLLGQLSRGNAYAVEMKQCLEELESIIDAYCDRVKAEFVRA